VKGQPVRFIQGHGKRGKKVPTVSAAQTTHGKSRTPEYGAYLAAKARCMNILNDAYADYGGRGIEFRFTSFEQFFAEVGLRPSPAHSLDRKNNDGHYEPGNVRWATLSEQNNNQRKVRAIQNFTDEEILAEYVRRNLGSRSL
jgi:hypothetical protein